MTYLNPKNNNEIRQLTIALNSLITFLCYLQVPAIFISRLVPGGLAESTGLLAVNDEVLEVNGIDVAGKKLDQVGQERCAGNVHEVEWNSESNHVQFS